ncbi:PD-(D/E)XK nuclease family protein [Patescibacteria group bacterium]
MSQFYNPNRKAEWNYGGANWKLSRSKITLFQECPKCFYLDNKLGTKRPPGYPFNLNSAVDSLLKQEFDVHRAKGTKHPLQKQYKLDMVPAKHEKIDEWRENFKGVQYLHEPTGMTVSGAIDDLWQNKKGEYVVVDYKATAKSEPVTALDQDWHSGYKRQMEIYQWLLRANGLKTSNTGYFVYCTGQKDAKAFDSKIEFDVHLIPYKGDDSWIEPTLLKIKKCLNSKKIPKSGSDCDYCKYREAANKVL